ncbi:MAG TPA: MobF family relaxase [Phycisphaerales bacterium]|nr:MobF family relaxase [Phycisphaerales bacterium]
MLRIVQNTSAAGAKSYYSTADYYTEGQELVGEWRGKGAERLGLAGTIDKADWDALCDNRNPKSGAKLMPRTKAERRVGYDFNFHCPKSLSVLYALTKDERLLDAFKEAVGTTMADMEAEMQTRVRKAGANEDRTTGNMLYGQFIHFTARPVGGIPDPHLHAHCFVFNSTFDAEENRWKAGQFAGLKRDAPYFEAVFHSVLARKIEELGLPVERTATGWEVAGVPQSVVDKFSRRTAQIEQEAKDKGITDPAMKDALGAITRERKAGQITALELDRMWRSRLADQEHAAISDVTARLGASPIPEDPKVAEAAMRDAMDHCFERSAVVPKRTILARAMKLGIGASSPKSIAASAQRQPFISRMLDGRTMVTTREVLAEEQAMLAFARQGRGSFRPLCTGYVPQRDWLTGEQRKAVAHVLHSPDRVILIRGAAGTGKTTMMQEAADGIRAGGHEVFTFAPSASASHGVLKGEAGFAQADTVAMLLTNQELQEQARGQVLWIDEAGLMGSRVTKQVFDLADRISARVVLSGDRKQHGSVERGGTLKLLETEAGLIPAQLRQVRRQSGAYKQAVLALSEGRTEEGFTRLNDLGWIKEIGNGQERYHALADAYLESTSLPGSTLVVCPTHAESERITSEIRGRLRQDGAITSGEHQLGTLRSVNLTEAQRRDPLSYMPGDVLLFHQNAPGHKKGTRVTVDSPCNDTSGNPLPVMQADRFTVFRPGRIELAVGDRVRITKNRVPKRLSGEPRLNNGDLFTLSGFTPKGDLVLDNGAVVPRDFGHIDYGYVVTSYASQGKSVDRVIIGQSSESFPASSKEQFYVSVSRGKKQALVLTDDKHALLEAVSHGDNRMTATELLAMRDHRIRTPVITALQETPFTVPPSVAREWQDRRHGALERGA